MARGQAARQSVRSTWITPVSAPAKPLWGTPQAGQRPTTVAEVRGSGVRMDRIGGSLAGREAGRDAGKARPQAEW